jgi:mono/diheme cytochrome c family protein
MNGRNRTPAWTVLFIVACGIGVAIPVQAEDEIDRVLAENGKMKYEQYCTSCHGKDGAPGDKAKTDLRTYVKRHGGKFPAADWIAIVADTRPGALHTDVWDQIRRDQVGTNADVAARGMVGQMARYIISIQSK